MASQRVPSPAGEFTVVASDRGLTHVHLPNGRAPRADEPSDRTHAAAAQLAEYLAGERTEFELPIDWRGVDDDHRVVLETLVRLAPYGSVVTYGELARESGCADARQAGQAMATNPLPIVVPCHRVVASDGLGGYGGGLALKRWLLGLEGAIQPELPF